MKEPEGESSSRQHVRPRHVLGGSVAVQKDANILPTVPGILDTCLSLPAAGQAPISKTLGCFQSLDSWEGSPKKTQVRCKYNDKKGKPYPHTLPSYFPELCTARPLP